MRGLPILLVLNGCDLAFGIDKLGPITALDATTDTASTCRHGSPFGLPERIDVGATYSAEAIRLNRQQTLAFLALATIPTTGTVDFETTDLYVSTVMDGVIQGHNKLAGLSSDFYDSYPTLTRDGEHMLFGSRRSGQQRLELATAVDHGFDHADVIELDVAGGIQANEPYAVGDQVLYFEAGTGLGELYRATGGPSQFVEVTPLGELNTADRENAPVVSEDELEIFFASDRTNPTAPGVSGLDIFNATRSDAGTSFSAPNRLAGLSSDDADYPVWLSPDNCDLYYVQKVMLVGSLYRVHRTP